MAAARVCRGFRRDGGAARGSSWAPRPASPLCCATSLPHCKMAAGPPGPGAFRDPSRSAITRHGHTEQPPRCCLRPAVAPLRRPGTPGNPSPVRESLHPAPGGSALRAAAFPPPPPPHCTIGAGWSNFAAANSEKMPRWWKFVGLVLLVFFFFFFFFSIFCFCFVLPFLVVVVVVFY